MAAPKTIGIVGAGTMGAGIAQKTAQSGLDVVMMDLGPDQLEAGIGRIRSMLEEGVKRGVFREGEPEKVLGRITTTSDAADMKDCDLVVEAVFENLEIKRKLFGQVAEHVRSDAVLATNTSSFLVAAVAEGLPNPERVVGLHYFFHPAKNRLLEVIPYAATSPEAHQTAWAFAEATGKTAIHSADAPGFVVNRFFVPWLNESVRLLQDDVADLMTIEATAKELFGIGMGPFELMNVTGVPIAQHAADGLASELGTFYTACDKLRAQVDSGELWPVEGAGSGEGAGAVEQRLLGVVLLVAALMVEEEVASAEDTDIGAKTGLRWPIGPFGLANKIGVERAVTAASAVADRYGLPLPAMLRERQSSPRPFELKAVTLTVEGELARVTVNRPDVLNALDPYTVGHLAKAFDAAAADPAVQAIVIEGRGKAFVAGADIKFFVNKLDSKDVRDIVDFTREGHELLLRIDRCDKPVVARLNGLALGGGAELALACDAIVADANAVLGFPETGIGIYPGLGGTQRTVKRCGPGVARYVVLTGDMIPARKALDLGLVDRVAEPGTTMDVVRELLASGAVTAGEGAGDLATPGEAKAHYEGIFTDANTAALLDGSFEPGEDQELGKIAKKCKFKAPIAMKIAAELIDQAADLPIAEGVKAELGRLKEIFGTADAYEGLSSVGTRRPEFKGA